MLQRPQACRGCALDDKASGYAPPEGPPSSPILFQAEALGGTEAAVGRPLMGDAGGMFQRLLNLLGWSRDAFRIINTCNCRPPGDWLGGTPKAPWYFDAIAHCAVHRDPVYAEGHKVVVPMGDTAIRTVLGLLHAKHVRVGDFHGTITRDPTNRFWVCPTFHPSFLQRGAHNLIGTVLWDLQQAEKVAQHGVQPDTGSLVIDPPLDWFHAWVDTVVAARLQDPESYPISSDIETPDKIGGKDEGELTADDRSYQILRWNVACHPDEGVTVPFTGPYIDELTRLHASPGPIWGWNFYGYDLDRTIAAGVLTEADVARIVDLMWYWHVLQSDLPRGLGFVAPFYSKFGPWKHLADSDPARYGAIDGLQTHRVGFGILGDLLKSGQLAVTRRHVQQLYAQALRPAQLVGAQIDRPRLSAFKEKLADLARTSLASLQACVPEEVCPLTPKQGLTAPPAAEVLHVKATAFTRKGTPRAGRPASEVKQELYTKARVIEQLVLREIMVCTICGETEVHRKHRCKVPYTKKDGTTGWKSADYDAALELKVASVTRWFWQEPFNPDSPPQVLAYLKFRKHSPGRAKKTRKDSTNRETLERLERKTKDPFYRHLLDYRAVVKVKGTYVEGIERRLDPEDRVHPHFTFRPSTQRLSCVDPNLQNVVADKEGQKSLAAGFRRCVVSSTDCRLFEADFSAIEAVQTGWLARDPDLIRLAKLSIHAGLASHVLGTPYDKTASEAEIRDYLQAIKKADPLAYDRSKRFIYGKLYGLTTQGMVLQLPHLFPTITVAEHYERIFRQMAPAAAKWQQTTQELAARQHYLGGVGDHPYAYKHWFWSVFVYKRLTATQHMRLLAKAAKAGVEAPVTEINGQLFRISLGEDGKRALAFKPSSIAAGNLKEAMLRLFDPTATSYIGDCKFGRTPLISPIHDSLLLDIPLQAWDRVVPLVLKEMQAPIIEQPLPREWSLGDYLSIGVGAKAGQNWAPYVDEATAAREGIEVNLEGMREIEVPGYSELAAGVLSAVEAEDEEDLADFGREIA